MVFISKRQRNFNDEMGDYLSSRGSGSSDSADSSSFFKKVDSMIPIRGVFSSSSNNVPELSNAVESTVYDENKSSFFSRFIAIFSSPSSAAEELEEEIENLPEDVREEVYELEDELTEVDEEVSELEEKREGLLKRLFSSIFGRRSSSVEDDEEFEHSEDVEIDPSEVLKSETRQTLKIIHKWISRLPPDQIGAFKRSPDFARYKDLLEKYDLLK